MVPPPHCGRLNGDATWWIDWAGQRVLFDPWLVGSETDFAPWFNRAWHTEPVVSPDEAGPFDIAVISQPYADHFHPETLERLTASRILTVPGCPYAGTTTVPDWENKALRIGSLRLWRLTRPWYRPPRYHVVVAADDEHRAIVHAPHGMSVATAHQIADRFDVHLLAISRATYQLPFFLGGAVNPGNQAAYDAAKACRPNHLLAIHDEPKRSVGLVSRLATVERGPWPGDPWNWLERTPCVPPRGTPR